MAVPSPTHFSASFSSRRLRSSWVSRRSAISKMPGAWTSVNLNCSISPLRAVSLSREVRISLMIWSMMSRAFHQPFQDVGTSAGLV
jgi:hypothetical protein